MKTSMMQKARNDGGEAGEAVTNPRESEKYHVKIFLLSMSKSRLKVLKVEVHILFMGEQEDICELDCKSFSSKSQNL